ncbi:hypothetical protein G6F31_019543 [Rhizopus arrhizus]|nr:hypothetical protein G6F31_019543 [Rhizopus arrhizus]
MVRLVIRLDAVPYFFQRQLAVIDRRGLVHPAPDQALAQAGLLARRNRLGPRLGQQLRVQVLQGPVRVDIHAREVGRDRRGPQRRRRRPQRVHVRVFALAQLRTRRSGTEGIRIVLSAMGRITDQRQGRPLGFMHGNRVEIGVCHCQSA